MKVKQIPKPGLCCRECILYLPSKDCSPINKLGISCGSCMEPNFKPWVQAADGTHSWNKQKKTLRKL